MYYIFEVRQAALVKTLERRPMLRYDLQGRVYTSVCRICTNRARDVLRRPSQSMC